MLPLIFLSLVSFQEPEIQKYEDARALSLKENKPLVILVTADWCKNCPAFKKLLRSKLLSKKEIVYTEINIDKDPIADKIVTERTVPQTVIFFNEDQKTKKKPFIGGGEDISLLEKFLERFKRK